MNQILSQVNLGAILHWSVLILILAITAIIGTLKKCLRACDREEWLDYAWMKILIILLNPGLGALAGVIPGFLQADTLPARVLIGLSVGFISSFAYQLLIKQATKIFGTIPKRE